MIDLNLTALGAWELTYFGKHVGDSQNARIRAPLIEPIEIPYLTSAHIFLVSAVYINAKPSWRRAGYFYQQINGIHIDDTVVFEGLSRIPTSEIDASRYLINLNTIQLVNFRQLTDSHALRFEPLPWIPQITLGVWEYRGTETDTTEELIQAVRAKLETIEYKIDRL